MPQTSDLMTDLVLRATYVGGPTVLMEIAGFRSGRSIEIQLG